MKIDVLDENQHKLDTITFSFDLKSLEKIEKDQNIPDIDNNTKKLLNTFDYLVGVYYLSNDGNIKATFFNDLVLSEYHLDLNVVKGINFSDIFFYQKEDKLLNNIMKDVYNTNKPKEFYFEYTEDNILYKKYDITITKVGEFIYFLGKNETNYSNLDYASLPLEQEELFKNNYNAIAILQDGHFVKVNKKYLEVYEQPSYESVIGQKLGYTGMDKNLVSEILKNFEKILNGKIYSYLFPIEIKKDGKLIHYFNINGSFTLYNSKAAVMVVLHDLTDEELNKQELKKKTEEALTLTRNLEIIQSVSKIGITYKINGVYTRSPQIYKIIERDFRKEDIYKSIILEITIDEDKEFFAEELEKLGSEKSSSDFIIRIRTVKGNLKYIHCYYNVTYLENNQEYIVLFYQDVTDEQLNIKKLYAALNESKRLNKNLNEIYNISKTGIGYYIEDEFSKDQYYPTFKLDWGISSFDTLKLYGEKYENYQGDLSEIILKEDLPIWQEAHRIVSEENPETMVQIRVINGEGDLTYLRCYILYDNEDNIIRHIIFHEDITEEIERENELRTALKDKEVLLTEVHHRVKNNLQIILSLINLNRGYETNPESILTDTENRIYAMALIHEKIYGSTSLADVNMKEYTESLVNSLLDTYLTNIIVHYDIEPIELNMEKSIPLGLIINELVTNTIKHAFPDDEEGNLYIKFKRESNKYILIIRDDGVGLPDDFDFDSLNSLGLMVVQNLTLQIDGTLTIMDCKGVGFKIEF